MCILDNIEEQYDRIFDIISNDDALYHDWRKFCLENAHRIPNGPGSAIRDARLTLIQEFWTIEGTSMG